MRAFRFQDILHMPVNVFDRGLGIKPARDAALIGHDQDVVAGFVEQTHRRRGAGNHFDIVGLVGVTAVDVEYAVAIEKRGWLSRARQRLSVLAIVRLAGNLRHPPPESLRRYLHTCQP